MLSLLQGVPIFAGLDDQALALLLERAERTVLPPGGVIVREGDNGNKLYVIDSGSVRVLKNFGLPNQVELTTMNAKDFFGEMCILDTLPRTATVVAIPETTIVSISCASFHHLYQQLPRQYGILLLNIARDLSRRLRHLDEVFASRH